MLERIHDWISAIFGPLLKPFFHPIHALFDDIYMPWARIAALALFLGTVLWVYSLRREYVNLEAPSDRWFHDLRIWTVLSMLPHVVIYLYV